ncbi:DUF2793 domain-containing protein [Hyphomicrobium sp. MC1]|uniref:DUF2793 domain-containing protein n=1 Tax=Hyphomicrobium sp. (strain MC1) TaxID=717785 RepID=UPI000213DCD7|nr:DUF2793 domain-containing protein [Hyphomicrobium sp. MC1]CCB64480.1 conserved protein of unknown function [Hyphomicrobium sp. MC1]
MADSVAVFPAGFRITDDSTGEPVSGAILYFYDAGTTAPKTVYSDEDLIVEIGTEIVCDTLGYPTSDGVSTKTLIYVGTAPYKIVCKDADDVTLWEHDNVKGAIVSASSLDISVTATFPVVTKSLDYSAVEADQNTTFAINCSGGDVTLTLPSAVTVGTGWKIKVQHAGSANQALIAVATGSGQLISEGSKSFGGAYALALNGEDCEITSDGGNWRVSSHTTPFVKVGQGIIPITDRVSAAPSSPVQGAIYLSTSSATWDGVSVSNGDVVQWSGAAWVPSTPYADCGWIAYVADENLYYHFVDSAWVAGALVPPADQAAMEALTANRLVTADVQKFHPGHPKAWVSGGGNPGSISVSHNVASITRNGVGDYSFTFTTPMSSANYCVLACLGSQNLMTYVAGLSTGGFSIITKIPGGVASDAVIHVAVFGDQ